MRYEVGFSEAARNDLIGLLEYLTPRAGERVARNYVDGIIDYCVGFEHFPKRGLARDDLRTGLRTVGYHRKATIAFQVLQEKVTILRIYHGGQNVDLAIFADGPSA